VRLGPKLGEGAGSDVFAWREGQVIKLFKPEFGRAVVEYELHATRTAFDAGADAPRVYGVEEVDGRIGLVLERLRGKSLLESVFAGETSPAETGAVVARLLHRLHAARIKTDLRTFRAWSLAVLDTLPGGCLPPDVAAQVRDAIGRLPEGGVLCHGDLHPGNVFLTPDGPRMLDWISALSADPLVDVARELLTFTIIAPDPRLEASRRAAGDALIETYAALTAQSPADLRAAVNPYMPVMAAMRMQESGSTAEERAMLVGYIRSFR
jgi:Ser/Thr protein kinase RdoA (MazF antagonist)